MSLGYMQYAPLTISSLIDHAAQNHPDREIVSKTPDGSARRCGYAAARSRAKRLANAPTRIGVGLSDRVGTPAIDSYRHFERFYDDSCMGVCSTRSIPGCSTIRSGASSPMPKIAF